MTVLVEVCVDSAAGLVAAVAGGAGRIELCSSLELGGLTPSPGLMRLAARLGCPTYAMVRPRAGDFVFDQDDVAVMRADIDAVRAAGLHGVVLGASRNDAKLDTPLLAELRAHAAGLGATLHRAFDLVPDRGEALETAVALGFERVLTSGGAATALDGVDALAALVRQAGVRLSIMAGGGVNPENAARVIAATGVREVHGSCRGVVARVAEADRIAMALGARQETQLDIVTRMVAAVGG